MKNVCAQQAKKNPHLSGWQAVRVGTEAMEQIMRQEIVEVNHGR